MTLARTLRSELQRLARSPLLIAHIACGVAGGVACGAYFAVSRWDPTMGADAFAQFLGALMPLMSGIACGLALDEEQAAGRLANLTALPSRSLAILAKLATLLLMAALALCLAFSLFAAIIAAAGRLTLGLAPMTLACAGVLAGSIPLYVLALVLSLRFGRNAAIGVGAVGTLVAFFSVGGLAHGLMTGELTGAMPSILAFAPGPGLHGWARSVSKGSSRPAKEPPRRPPSAPPPWVPQPHAPSFQWPRPLPSSSGSPASKTGTPMARLSGSAHVSRKHTANARHTRYLLENIDKLVTLEEVAAST